MSLDCGNIESSWNLGSLDKEPDTNELGGSGKVSVDDAVSKLPIDPFNMDVNSTYTAFTGWVQDVKTEFWDFHGCGSDEIEKNIGDQPFLSGLNLGLSGTMMFQQEKGNLDMDEISSPYSSFSRYGIGDGVCDGDFAVNGVVCNNKSEEVDSDCSEGGALHDALFFALGYLGVKDLLVVEMVCRSLRDAVRGDPLLWRSIHIDQPLNEKVTDDALVKLTGRAQGTLECLSLVQCFRITDTGLKRVLEGNLGLKKLSVPGCLKLSVEGILFNLRAFKSAGSPGIKHLRIGGLLGITDMQFEELKCLLGADDVMQLSTHEPMFYRLGQLYLSCDDDRAIDIEKCPKCKKPGLVYDCPTESCQAKHHAAQSCRACTLCIARCFYCGGCINDCDYVETFCLDMLCLDCLRQLIIVKEKSEVKGASSSKRTIFCQGTSYELVQRYQGVESITTLNDVQLKRQSLYYCCLMLGC